MIRTRSSARVLCVALLFSTSFICQAFAQGSTMQISGTIKDASGGVLSGAVVETVVADRVVASVSTDAKGEYRVEVARGVPFELRVHLDGFADYVASLTGMSANLTRNVTMQVGTVSDTLVVTSSRGTESRASLTSSTSVATAEEIHTLGASQLSEVLRFVPGLAVEGAGREGALTSVFARGGDSDYNVVLIDGVRANLDGGRFDFSRIAAGEIERVEVVRGPQSSLWGADAMGSVVQVFTRRAGGHDAPQLSGSVEGGSYDTWRGDTHITGGARKRVDYSGGVTYRRTDGAFDELLADPDWFEQTAFDGAIGASLGTRASVRSGLRYSHAQGRSVGQVTYGSRDSGGAYDTKDFTWYANGSHAVGPKYTGTGTVNYFRYSSVSADGAVDPAYSTYAILSGTPNVLFPDGIRLVRTIDQTEFAELSAAGALPGPGEFLASTTINDSTFRSAFEFRRPAVKYQGDFEWTAGQRTSAGYDWERETNPNVTGFDLDNNAFFIQHQATFADRWYITVGARVDNKESYDTFFSPKLSAGGFVIPVRPGELSSLKVYGNVGQGVKSPTFTERFGGAFFADPNPDIKPERAESWDLGVEATFADQYLRAQATYFHNKFVDQISFRSGSVGDGIPEFINIDGSKAQGLELELALQRSVGGFTASGAYSYIDTEVVTNQSTSEQFQPGQPLLRRPRNSGSVRAGYRIGSANVSFDLRMVGERFDNTFFFPQLRSVPNAERPAAFSTDITINPGYTVAGLGLDYSIGRSVTVYVRGNNITNTEYDSVLGYPGMPRTVMAGARFLVGRLP